MNRLSILAQHALPKPVFELFTGHKRDVLFFWIPKTAGTSVYNVMLEYGCPPRRWRKPMRPFRNRGFVTFAHINVVDLVKAGVITRKYFANAFKFAFVRNPFDRLVSLYFHYQRLKWPDVPDDMTFEKFCEAVTQTRIDPVGLYNTKGLNRCNPQVDWLCDRKGRLRVDYVGRFENLEHDFAKVCARIGIRKPEMPHKNKTEHAPYRDYYNAETRQMVGDFYRRDLEMFGYAF
ncbi:MAG: hypothetical protein QOG48_1024 [Verrucomicrobiota bacterium]|jgi:hypothetical protein